MPNPSDYKDKNSFMAACVPMRIKEGKDSSHEQSVAACYGMWESHIESKKKSAIDISNLEKQGKYHEVDECLSLLAD